MYLCCIQHCFWRALGQFPSSKHVAHLADDVKRLAIFETTNTIETCEGEFDSLHSDSYRTRRRWEEVTRMVQSLRMSVALASNNPHRFMTHVILGLV